VSEGTLVSGFPGEVQSVSADGSSNGIVWSLQVDGFGSSSAAILRAYDANDLSTPLYSSDQAGPRDMAGAAVKFTTPTIVNGMVYIGTQYEIDAYGLLGQSLDMSARTVRQTELVSDLPGAARPQNRGLVNPRATTESRFISVWNANNNASVATLYSILGPKSAPVSINLLVISISAASDLLGSSGGPAGNVFNTDGSAMPGFTVRGVDAMASPITAFAVFIFATGDSAIVGWNVAVNPHGLAPGTDGTRAIIAVDNSGNDFLASLERMALWRNGQGPAEEEAEITEPPSGWLSDDDPPERAA
jgi:hypothetical protein